MILGLDIGGANTKITVLDNNYYKIFNIYLPFWKEKEKVIPILKEIKEEYNPEYVGLVFTAELADCYKSKKEGVEDIIKKVCSVFNNIYILDVNGNFLSPSEAIKNYLSVSASNWVASAKFILDNINKECVFIDMGSTTTDIIPIKNKILACKTDFERLMENQLLYVGTLRTPLSFLANKIKFNGRLINVSSEYFSITADLSIIFNKISPDKYTCDTPDNGGKDLESCLLRVARVVCADREILKDDDIIEIARYFYNSLLNLIKNEVETIKERYNLNDIVITGLGEEILKDIYPESISIKELYGEDVSISFPSFAVASLLAKEINYPY